MINKIRVITLIGLVLFPAVLFAQFNNNTTSPYSRYGIGDLQPYSFGRSVAMGGTGIAVRNGYQINMANPASYSAIDTLGFMFEFGMNGKFTSYKTDLGSTGANDVNFQYFAMNFQVSNRIGAAMGLVPFSDVGYDVKINDDIENTGPVQTNYYGVGTISQAFIGLGVEPFKNLSLGANLNYTFGMLNRNSEVAFYGASDFYSIQQYKNLQISDFGVEFGAQATIPLKNNNKIILGVVYEHNPTYVANTSDLTQKIISSGNSTDRDTLNLLENSKGKIEYPRSVGVGLSYSKLNKLEINADYVYQAWGDSKFFGEGSAFLTDLNKFALGAEWIPDKFSIRSYTNRIAYRAGLKYEQTYLVFNGQQINDFGISFGVGLPVYRSNSTINVAAEIGRKGTKSNNLVLENYARLNLSVNLYDLWFIKRRFD